MAADLHIHIFEGIAEKDLAFFFSNSLGSKYMDWHRNATPKQDREVFDKIANTPQIWVGEVSWLKAMLFEDNEQFIPNPVGEIQELIGEDLPVLDNILIKKILQALSSPNSTKYSVTTAETIRPWLLANKGKRVFTVSW